MQAHQTKRESVEKMRDQLIWRPFDLTPFALQADGNRDESQWYSCFEKVVLTSYSRHPLLGAVEAEATSDPSNLPVSPNRGRLSVGSLKPAMVRFYIPR